ncbi:DUF305 domain-containing protein [Herbidospora mongoliensis]|uniref:DUF305 domain-containing protein n=1 Tax=Herbidospora mongoliensis TaxID=688067 RepID=UPI00082ED742|nr:DUF305 domain-containing protein [Herbidospora mongoliensis]
MTTFPRIALPAIVAAALMSGCAAETVVDAAPSPAATSAATSAAPIPTVTASQESSATEPAEEPTATEEPEVVADAGPNVPDKTFAAALITHNLQAYDLTGLAATAAGDQWVRDFAAAYRAEREPEVETLKGWLAEWEVEPLKRGQPMPGLISEKDMADLAGSAGAAFDERFAALMIQHQKGALKLAGDEADGGSYGPAVQMANAIIEAGDKQLKELQKFQKSL